MRSFYERGGGGGQGTAFDDEDSAFGDGYAKDNVVRDDFGDGSAAASFYSPLSFLGDLMLEDDTARLRRKASQARLKRRLEVS